MKKAMAFNMSYSNFNDGFALEVILQMDPKDLLSLVQTDQRLQDIYDRHESTIWKQYIKRDLGDYPGSTYEAYQMNVARVVNFSDESSDEVRLRLQQIMRLPNSVLKTFTRPKWGQIIKRIIKEVPELLHRVVAVLSEQFYSCFNDLDSEYTYLCLSYVKQLSEYDLEAAKIALPHIYALFVNPTLYNPLGLFNAGYSSHTKTFLERDLLELQTIVPLPFA